MMEHYTSVTATEVLVVVWVIRSQRTAAPDKADGQTPRGLQRVYR